MSPSAQPRNNVVVQRESGHPGFRNDVFIATPSGLRDVAARLEQLAQAEPGTRFGVHVTERGDPKSRGSLVFAQCDDEQLVSLQQQSPRVTLKKILVGAFYVGLLTLVVTGWLTVVGYLRQWLDIPN